MTSRARTTLYLALGLALLAGAVSPAVGAQGVDVLLPDRRQSDAAVRKLLFRLEDDFARAVVRRDPRALNRIVATRWVYTDESGVMNREEGIRAFTTGTDTVRQAANSDMKAYVYPGAAAVTGVLTLTGSGPAGPFTRRYRYTDTWALIGGRWRCIASQDYLLPETKPAR